MTTPRLTVMDRDGDKGRRPSYIARDGRDGRDWKIVYPAGPDDGMDTAAGPFLTRLGARLARWLWG